VCVSVSSEFGALSACVLGRLRVQLCGVYVYGMYG